MTTILEKPIPPADDDCCGGGSCCPCVWDFYYDARRAWKVQQAELAKAAEDNNS